MEKKVTVCVPTYNEEDNIIECILSISRQKFDGEVEILISDNASTDRTCHLIKWMKMFDERIKLCEHKENVGCKGNLERLVNYSKHNILIFMSANDVMRHDCIKEIHRLFSLQDSINVITRPYYFFNTRKGSSVPIRKTKRDNLTYSDIIASCGQMSGIGIRKDRMVHGFCDRYFVEFVHAIFPMIPRDNFWQYVRFSRKYLVAVRNTGGGSYNRHVYKQSPIQNWIYATNWKTAAEINRDNFVGLIQIKAYGGNEALFWEWIYMEWLDHKNGFRIKYWLWFYALLICPAWLLRNLLKWWWNR